MMDECIISRLCLLGFLPHQRCYISPMKLKGRVSTALVQIIGAMGPATVMGNRGYNVDYIS